jgi:hypothetical protein
MTNQELAIAIALQANVRVLLVSREGTGKSTFSEMLVTQGLGWRFHPWILSTMDLTIMGGMPHVMEREICGQVVPVIRRTPEEAFVETALDTENIHVHMFDEFSNATRTQRSQMLDAVTGYRAGGYPLAHHTRWMAAMNPANCAVVYHDMAPPTSTRWTWIDWEPALDRESWRRGMLTGWQTPTVPRLAEGWEQALPVARAMLVEFEKRCPTVFHEGFDLNADGKIVCANPGKWLNRPRSNPRTLEQAAKVYAATLGLEGVLPEDKITSVRTTLIKGTLGEDCGRMLLEFLAVAREIPSPQELINDYSAHPVHEMRPDLQYLAVSSVGAWIGGLVRNQRNHCADEWAKALMFVGNLEDNGLGDLGMLCAGLFLTKEIGIPTGAVAPKNTIARILPLLREIKEIAAEAR